MSNQSSAAMAKSKFIDEQGNLNPAPANPRLRFGFIVSEIPYEARVDTSGDIPSLVLRADIATMPYSAEAPEARKAIIAVMTAARHARWGACGLSAKQRITITSQVPIDGPTTPIDLVSAAIRFILQSRPFIHRVQQEMLAHGARA